MLSLNYTLYKKYTEEVNNTILALLNNLKVNSLTIGIKIIYILNKYKKNTINNNIITLDRKDKRLHSIKIFSFLFFFFF